MSNAFCASKTVGDFSRDKDQILELTDQNSSLKVCIFLFECLHRAFDFFFSTVDVCKSQENGHHSK